jgi:carboxymethylenebutenolidase
MGGALALRTAAFYPDRVAAAASFHGGNQASDKPSSPHLLADKIKAEVYVGHAKDDPSCPAEQQERLEQAFNAAGVTHQKEVYEAAHAWTMPDVPWAKNDAAREKAWNQLYKLLDRTLK